MAYDRRKLVADVEDQLYEKPRSLLDDISFALGVDRHAIQRAIRDLGKKSFRECQKQTTLRKAVDLLSHNRERADKQISIELGYRSPEAFSRFIRAMTGKT